MWSRTSRLLLSLYYFVKSEYSIYVYGVVYLYDNSNNNICFMFIVYTAYVTRVHNNIRFKHYTLYYCIHCARGRIMSTDTKYLIEENYKTRFAR